MAKFNEPSQRELRVRIALWVFAYFKNAPGGVSQTRFCEKLGIRDSMLSAYKKAYEAWESGAKVPAGLRLSAGVDTLYKLRANLGVNVNHVLVRSPYSNESDKEEIRDRMEHVWQETGDRRHTNAAG